MGITISNKGKNRIKGSKVRTHFTNAALLAIFSTGMVMPTISSAAVQNSQSIIYLDPQDNIIGQSIIYCNQITEHAGTIDQTNPYKIVERGSCDINKSPTMGIVVFQSATGKSVQYYCKETHSIGTPFYGAPGCNQSQPMRATVLGPYTPGFE